MERSSEQTKCLACGEALAQALRVAGSLRCHDCRDAHAPLREDLVEPQDVAALQQAA
jgi:alkylhydroperoxidase family enzyme